MADQRPSCPPPREALPNSAPDGAQDWRERAGTTRRLRSERAILGAARALFQRHRYDDVTVEAIAELAGVAPGTVYNRFGTKGGVAASLLTGWLEPLDRGAADDIARGLPVTEAIPRHFERLGAFIDADRHLAEALFLAVIEHSQQAKSPAAPTDPRRVMALPRALTTLLWVAEARGELRDGLDLDDLGRIWTAFLATRVLARDETAARSGAVVADLLLEGIRPRRNLASGTDSPVAGDGSAPQAQEVAAVPGAPHSAQQRTTWLGGSQGAL
jgi:AcrR family transcriptional regulator